ncbi:PRC-barrel domain-containing protein, partial [Methylobacterium brachiatum]|uniref:PRC-barrel domain-containing protein n=1 Tax=Methylobacterium brachiatum TaxID=269660 RepID=UPI0024471EEB
MIAAVTLALWASGVAAQAPSSPGDGASGQAPPQASPPSPPVAPPAPGATTGTAPATPPAPATPAAPANAAQQQQQQGTPATVLDTQDYESLLGRSVRSAGGDELGRVIDIIIDKDGHPRAAIIDFGGFLGVGTRKIAVDWRALRFTPDGNKERKLSVGLTRNQVRVSPEYKAGEPIVVLGPASPAAPPPDGD